ncbi:hypothetical protein ABPG74_002913 [Tetrahymena malaccensis]
MKILIVNGYSATPKGSQLFTNFQFIIYKLFKEHKIKIDDEQEFYIRDRNNLEDFIYELNSPFLKKESATQFDLLDMIFIVGDSNLRPWSPTAEQMLILLRMCMKSQKVLFACSFGFQGLIYLSASNFEKPYNVINGYLNGSQISDLLKSNINPSNLTVHDIFIDNVTGDILVYNFESSNWIPKGNTGLHYNKAAQEYSTIGKYILKAPNYQPKSNEEQLIYLNSNTETICRIKKRYISHWAFKGIDANFKVPTKNQWDAHPFTSVNPDKQFQVLAESQRGPLIIESKQMFAIQFSLNEKYPETIQLVENYLLHFIEQYQSQKIVYKNIQRCVESASQEENAYFRSRKKEKKLIMQREIKYSQISNKINNFKTSLDIENEINQFKHVGLSANHQHNQYIKIDNNAIINLKYANPKMAKQKSKSLDNSQLKKNQGHYQNKDEIKGEESQLKKVPILFRTYKKVDREMNKQFQIMSMHRKSSLSQSNQNDVPNIQLNNTEESSKQKDSSECQDNINSFNQYEVRKFLHPSLSQDSLCDKFTCATPSNSQDSSKIFVKYNNQNLQTNQEKTFLRSFYRTKINSTYSQASGMFQIASEPYVTQQEIERSYQKEQDKKIIGSKRFFTYLSRQSSQNQSQQSSYMQQSNQTFYNKVGGGSQKIQQFNVKNMLHQKWISVSKDYKF